MERNSGTEKKLCRDYFTITENGHEGNGKQETCGNETRQNRRENKNYSMDWQRTTRVSEPLPL